MGVMTRLLRRLSSVFRKRPEGKPVLVLPCEVSVADEVLTVQGGANEIENYGFANGLLAPWEAPMGGAVIVTTDLGDKACELTATAWIQYLQSIPISTEDRRYRVLYRSKRIAGAALDVYVSCRDAADANLYAVGVQADGPIGEWVWRGTTLLAPAGTETLLISCQADQGGQVVQLTDFVLVPLADASSVVLTSEIPLGTGTVEDLLPRLRAMALEATVLDLSSLSLLARPLQAGAATGVLEYPTSLLWGELLPQAWILDEQAERIQTAKAQLSPLTAAGTWLAYWGSHFGVSRRAGEPDADYGRRIVREVLRLSENNRALELIVQDAFGVAIRVVDAQTLDPAPADAECHFAVEITYPPNLTSAERTALRDAIYETLRRCKAAGTDLLDGAETVTYQYGGEAGGETFRLGDFCLVTVTVTPETVPETGVETFSGDTLAWGGGLRWGCPGLFWGAHNAPLIDQCVIEVLDAATDERISLEITRG